jgi:malonate-semialdehyde dehydrogenase (acetylating)/methylmalonate-semialdehyde dehydrogenase
VDGASAGSHAATEELFGPILTIIRCENLSEALEIERSSVYGNAASVFTTSGLVADRVACEASAGMVGVNIGVPVPREPFSFGGINASKFGQGDITGHGSLDFWSDRKKITSKWVSERAQNWMS